MALKIKNKTMQFGGQLGGKTFFIIFLVVSLILLVAYAREGEGDKLSVAAEVVEQLGIGLTLC